MVALSVPIQMHLQIFPSQQLRGRHFTQHPLQISTIFRKNVYTDRNLKVIADGTCKNCCMLFNIRCACQAINNSVLFTFRIQHNVADKSGERRSRCESCYRASYGCPKRWGERHRQWPVGRVSTSVLYWIRKWFLY